MKKLLTIIIIFFTLSLSSCMNKGDTMVKLNGTENLPDELKGLKVYTVSTGHLSYVKVAILNDNINSTTYSQGKTEETTIIVNPRQDNQRTIYAKGIIMENDSMILVRK